MDKLPLPTFQEMLPPSAPLAMPKQKLEREPLRLWALLLPRFWAKHGQ